MNTHAPSHLSDDALQTALHRLARCERETMISHLAEFDARKLFRGAGFESMFAYCTGELRLSEGGAYNRIEVARASRRIPALLERMAEGHLTLTTARLIAPHLTDTNQASLLAAAAGKSRIETEKLIAAIAPRAEVPPSVRKVPVRAESAPTSNALAEPADLARAAVGHVAVAGPAATVETAAPSAVRSDVGSRRPANGATPVSAHRYEFRFTAGEATREKVRVAQDLLRHAIPDGDLAEIFDRALTLLIEDAARKKFAASDRPGTGRTLTPGSRHIPAQVRREVWRRDGGRCAFVARTGRRCEARGFLEFHHKTPFAEGGEPTVENIELRCRAHNAYEAELFYGMDRALDPPATIGEARASYEAPRPVRGVALVPGRVRAPMCGQGAA
jgi:hypothetical protein